MEAVRAADVVVLELRMTPDEWDQICQEREVLTDIVNHAPATRHSLKDECPTIFELLKVVGDA
jgi:hypothetical protein